MDYLSSALFYIRVMVLVLGESRSGQGVNEQSDNIPEYWRRTIVQHLLLKPAHQSASKVNKQ